MFLRSGTPEFGAVSIVFVRGCQPSLVFGLGSSSSLYYQQHSRGRTAGIECTDVDGNGDREIVATETGPDPGRWSYTAYRLAGDYALPVRSGTGTAPGDPRPSELRFGSGVDCAGLEVEMPPLGIDGDGLDQLVGHLGLDDPAGAGVEAVEVPSQGDPQVAAVRSLLDRRSAMVGPVVNRGRPRRRLSEAHLIDHTQRPGIVHGADAAEHDIGGRNVLVGTRFWYFGENSQSLPQALAHLTHTGVGHCVDANRQTGDIAALERWLVQWPCGVHGEPVDATPATRQWLATGSIVPRDAPSQPCLASPSYRPASRNPLRLGISTFGSVSLLIVASSGTICA